MREHSSVKRVSDLPVLNVHPSAIEFKRHEEQPNKRLLDTLVRVVRTLREEQYRNITILAVNKLNKTR